MPQQGSGGNVIAAICNIFIPGLGQLVQGRILRALMFLLSLRFATGLQRQSSLYSYGQLAQSFIYGLLLMQHVIDHLTINYYQTKYLTRCFV